MIKMKMSHHAVNDRLDRLTNLALTLGMGEVIFSRPDHRHPGTIKEITTTGIILCKSEQNGCLITAFMATVEQAYELYGGRPPQTIFNTVKYNNKKYSFLLKNT